MKEKDTKTELMLEIANMYVVSVFEGRYTKPSSFVAIGEDAKEFFVSKQLVEKKSELIKMLSKRNKPLWVLVKDEIWGGKWNNKEVSEIVAISENKRDCEDYKAKLIMRIQLEFDLFELHERHFKLIEDSYKKPSFNEEEQNLLRDESILREKLLELDTWGFYD